MGNLSFLRPKPKSSLVVSPPTSNPTGNLTDHTLNKCPPLPLPLPRSKNLCLTKGFLQYFFHWFTFFQVWKSPWRREQLPTPVFLPGKSHAQRSYSPWPCQEMVRHSWVTDTFFRFHPFQPLPLPILFLTHLKWSFQYINQFLSPLRHNPPAAPIWHRTQA